MSKPVIVAGVRPVLTEEQKLRIDVRELVAALEETLQSLEYLRDKHGHHITGTMKLSAEIDRASFILSKHKGKA